MCYMFQNDTPARLASAPAPHCLTPAREDARKIEEICIYVLVRDWAPPVIGVQNASVVRRSVLYVYTAAVPCNVPSASQIVKN